MGFESPLHHQTKNKNPERNEKRNKNMGGMKPTLNEKNTTQLVIKILGLIAITGLIGTLLIIAYTPYTDIAIITALIAFISSTTGGLIGYLGANKTPNNPKEEEDDGEVNSDVQPTETNNTTEKQ